MMRARALVMMVVASLAAASLAAAEPQTFKLDPAHTHVGFNVRHFFSKVPGEFTSFTGTIQLDDKNWAASSVEATIQATSISTNHEKRDNHLRSGDFFEVEKYPTITFKSTKVTPAGEGVLKVAGDLTMKGVTKPVVLDVSYLGSGPVVVEGNPAGSRAGFEARTTVDRKDYGILWNKALDQGGTLLGDEVTITIGVEAMKADAPKMAPKEKQETPDKATKK